jgi:hypothetical protein
MFYDTENKEEDVSSAETRVLCEEFFLSFHPHHIQCVRKAAVHLGYGM